MLGNSRVKGIGFLVQRYVEAYRTKPAYARVSSFRFPIPQN